VIDLVVFVYCFERSV